MADYLPFLSLSTMLVQSFAALQLIESHLQAQGKVSQPPIPPCLFALSFSLGQQAQVWMAKIAKEEEEEIWEEEEGVWAKLIS